MPEGLIAAGTEYSIRTFALGFRTGCNVARPDVKIPDEGLRDLAESEAMKEWAQQAHDARVKQARESPIESAVVAYVYQAGVLRAWAALEICSRELWTETLNHTPLPILEKVFASLGERKLPVSKLAKHGFEVNRSEERRVGIGWRGG